MEKSTFPGKLDTAIGGGMIYGLSVQENLEKEAEEEAAVSPLASATAKFIKLARYCWHTEFYIKREAILIFDLDLSHFNDPRPNDGEQDCFQLCHLNDQIFQQAEKWKPNSLAASLDFAKRNGLLVESEVLEQLLSDKCNLFAAFTRDELEQLTASLLENDEQQQKRGYSMSMPFFKRGYSKQLFTMALSLGLYDDE